MTSINRLLLLGLFLTIGVPSSWADQVTGRVSILWDKPQPIQLVPDLKLYPGQVINVVSDGKVDVDHEFGEHRRCKWFGLKCWYEPWDRPNWVPAASMDVELLLEEGTVTQADGGYKLDIPLAQNFANFTSGVRLSGMLWKQGHVAPIQRGPCIGRPQYCSQGDLTLTFAKVDVSGRLNALESILSKQRIQDLNVLVVTGRDFIDPLLFQKDIASDSSILRVSEILSKAIAQYRNSIPDKSGAAASPLHLKVIDLSAYALKLSNISNQDAAKIRTIVTESFLDRGDYAAATTEAPKMMADAQSAYNEKNDAPNALVYARALKTNAGVWREKGAKNSSSDIKVSIALLDKATDVLWKHVDFDVDVAKVMSEVNVDAARMLNVLRTGAELKSAEERMVAAICFQMYSEQGGRNSYIDWVDGVKDGTVKICRNVKPSTEQK